MGKAHLLGQVAGFHREALAHGASVGRLLPQDDFQQGGLAGAVVPQKGDPVPVLHPEGHPVEKGLAAEGLVQVLDLQQIVGVKLRLAELGPELFVLGGPGGALHPGHPLFDGEGPLVEQLRVVLVHSAHGV